MGALKTFERLAKEKSAPLEADFKTEPEIKNKETNKIAEINPTKEQGSLKDPLFKRKNLLR